VTDKIFFLNMLFFKISIVQLFTIVVDILLPTEIFIGT